MLLDLLPVGLRVSLNWFDSEFPRAFYSSVFLHAILACSIIYVDSNVMTVLVSLLKSGHSLLSLKVHIELNMRSALLALLKLSNDIDSSTCFSE